jgi:hypothetical protein
VEALEDIVLCTDFKSELLAVMLDISGSTPLDVSFSDNMSLESSQQFKLYSMLPANKLVFNTQPASLQTGKNKVDQYTSGLNHSFNGSGSNDQQLEVIVPPGVPDSMVQERVARAEKRRRKREKRMKEERELEAKRRAKRLVRER